MIKTERWSAGELEFIRKHYLEHTAEELAVMLGRSAGAVRSAVNRKKLRPEKGSAEYTLRVNKRLKRDSHLCWYCVHSAGTVENQCSWALGCVPVEGWKTKEERGYIEYESGAEKRFSVVYCPIYEEEKK